MELKRALEAAGVEALDYGGNLHFLDCAESRQIMTEFDIFYELYPGGTVCVRNYMAVTRNA